MHPGLAEAKFGPDPTMETLDITGGVAKIGSRWQRRTQQILLYGMTEPPQAVDWATTEGEREEFRHAIRSGDSERASSI